MECPKCRSNNKEDAKKCSMCEYNFASSSISSANVNDQKSPEKNKSKKSKSSFSLMFSSEDIKDQVDGYSTLKFSKTFRGTAIFATGFYLLFAIAYGFMFSVEDAKGETSIEFILGFFAVYYLIVVLVFAALLFFVYKGHRWPLWLLMLYAVYLLGSVIFVFTVEKNISFEALIWPIVLLIFYYKTLIVENKRRKIL